MIDNILCVKGDFQVRQNNRKIFESAQNPQQYPPLNGLWTAETAPSTTQLGNKFGKVCVVLQ